MKRRNILATVLLASILILHVADVHAQSEPVVVRAVLFYSPTCGHCEYVISETLMPMMGKYGDQLQIIGIDVSQQQGQFFFMSAMQMFKLDSAGVPFLVIDDTYLIGSVDIPEKFPGMVESYLAQGGVDWPDIPELREAIALSAETGTATAAAASPPEAVDGTAVVPSPSEALQSTPVPAAAASANPTPTTAPGIIGIPTDRSDWRETFARDVAGNTLSVIVLAGMLGSMIWAGILFKNSKGTSIKDGWAWTIPLLCLIGFGVAGYLAYIETTNTTAVCGPVGDCNTVQQSDYAQLFGVLPIGVLGLFGYVAIFASWLVARYANDRLAKPATIALFVMAAGGTLFSIYLTFLEPFVIGATCAWCLTSAVLMTALMLLLVRPAKGALTNIPG